MYFGMKSTFLNSVTMAGLWYRLKSLLQFERRTSLGIGNFAISPSSNGKWKPLSLSYLKPVIDNEQKYMQIKTCDWSI